MGGYVDIEGYSNFVFCSDNFEPLDASSDMLVNSQAHLSYFLEELYDAEMPFHLIGY